MRVLLVHHGLEQALKREKGLPATMSERENKEVLDKAHSALILSLGDKVLREVSKEKSTVVIWNKLENLYKTKSLANKLYNNNNNALSH